MSITKKILVSAFALAISFGVASASAAYMHTTTLKFGSTGSQVMSLQQTLNMTSCKVAVSGVGSAGWETTSFGAKTLGAVKCFQMANGLTADGVVGPMTGAKLYVVSSGSNSGNFPAGCTSAAGYSTTTGLPCTSNSSLPAGCTSTAGFSPVTGARCDGTGNNNNGGGGSLSGGAGSITVSDLSTYSSEEVGEDEQDAKVLAFEVEADDDSDVEVTSIKVELVESGATSSEDITDYAESISVWFDGKEVGSADADDFTENNDIYTKSISLNGVVIKAGETETITVSVTGLSNLDSGDIDSDLWTIDVLNVRFEDGDGVVTTEDTDADALEQTFDFASFASANDVELNVALNDDDDAINEAHVIDVDDNDDTEDVEILSFTLEADGDSDINVTEIPVLLTVTGAANVDDLITNISLMHGTDEVGSESVGSAVGATKVYTFDDLDLDIGAGDTEEFTVVVTLKSTADVDLDNGDTIMADLDSTRVDLIEAEDESGEELTSTELTGTADGEASEVRDQGIMVEFVSATQSRSFVADAAGEFDQGTFEVTFDVTAFDADMRIDFSCEEGGADAAGQGVEYTITNSASNSTSCNVTSNDTDTEDTANTKEIDEDTTRRFTLSVTATSSADAYAEVALESINYGTATDNTNATYYTFDLGEFKTGSVFLNTF